MLAGRTIAFRLRQTRHFGHALPVVGAGLRGRAWCRKGDSENQYPTRTAQAFHAKHFRLVSTPSERGVTNAGNGYGLEPLSIVARAQWRMAGDDYAAGMHQRPARLADDCRVGRGAACVRISNAGQLIRSRFDYRLYADCLRRAFSLFEVQHEANFIARLQRFFQIDQHEMQSTGFQCYRLTGLQF